MASSADRQFKKGIYRQGQTRTGREAAHDNQAAINASQQERAPLRIRVIKRTKPEAQDAPLAASAEARTVNVEPMPATASPDDLFRAAQASFNRTLRQLRGSN